MFCAQCGNTVAEGAASCARCGAPVGGAATMPVGQSAMSGGSPMGGGSPVGGGGPSTVGGGSTPGGTMQGYNFDAGRLSQADKITGVASVVLLISLFLPWFSISGLGITISWSGMTAHGYLWVVFLLCLAIVAFLVFEAGFAELPVKLPVGREMLLLAVSGINLLLVLLAFFVSPGYLSLGVGWSFGAFIALIAAIAACAPLAVPMLRARSGR
jgi:hypothetical protein